jgi:hypothetical protein
MSARVHVFIVLYLKKFLDFLSPSVRHRVDLKTFYKGYVVVVIISSHFLHDSTINLSHQRKNKTQSHCNSYYHLFMQLKVNMSIYIRYN